MGPGRGQLGVNKISSPESEASGEATALKCGQKPAPQEVPAPSWSGKVLKETPLWTDPKVLSVLFKISTLLIVNILLKIHCQEAWAVVSHHTRAAKLDS